MNGEMNLRGEISPEESLGLARDRYSILVKEAETSSIQIPDNANIAELTENYENSGGNPAHLVALLEKQEGLSEADKLSILLKSRKREAEKAIRIGQVLGGEAVKNSSNILRGHSEEQIDEYEQAREDIRVLESALKALE